MNGHTSSFCEKENYYVVRSPREPMAAIQPIVEMSRTDPRNNGLTYTGSTSSTLLSKALPIFSSNTVENEVETIITIDSCSESEFSGKK